MKTGPGRHTGPTAEGGEVTTDRERSQHVPITKPEKSGALPNPKRSTTETAKTKTHRQKQQTGKPRAQKGEAPQGTQNHTRDRGRQKKHEKSWTAQEKDMQDAEEP